MSNGTVTRAIDTELVHSLTKATRVSEDDLALFLRRDHTGQSKHNPEHRKISLVPRLKHEKSGKGQRSDIQGRERLQTRIARSPSPTSPTA